MLTYDQTMQQLRELERQGLVGPQGVLEALANTIGQTAVTAGSGLGGLWELLASGGDVKSAVDRIHSIQSAGSDALPQLSPEGQRAMANAMEVMQPIGEALQAGGKGAGNYTLEKTGSPLAATIAHTLIEGAPDIAAGAFALKPRPRLAQPTGLITAEQAAKPTAPTSLLPAPAPKPAPQSLLPAPVRKPTPAPDPTPALLKTPTGKPARVNEATMTYSGLEQAMNDMIAEYTAKGKDLKMTRAQLGKRLKGRGVTMQEMEESAMDFAGPEVVSVADEVRKLNRRGRNPSERMELYQETGRYEQLVPDIKLEDITNAELKPVPYENTTFIGESHVPVWKRAYTSGEVRPSKRQEYTNIIHRAAREASIETGVPWESVAKGLEKVENEYGVSRSTGYPMDAQEAMTALRVGAGTDTSLIESMNKHIHKILQDNYEQDPIMGYQFENPRGQPVEARLIKNPTYADEPQYKIYDDGVVIETIPVSAGPEGLLAELGKSKARSQVKYSNWKRGTPVTYEENVILTDEGFPRSRDSHFPDVEGYVGHSRVMDQRTEDGLRTRHIIEVQSGPHQEGRKVGYKSNAESERLARMRQDLATQSRELAVVTEKLSDRDVMAPIAKKIIEHDGDDYVAALNSEIDDIRREYPDMNDIAAESMAEYRLILEATAMLEDPSYLTIYKDVPEFVELAQELQTARAQNKELMTKTEQATKALARKSENIPLKNNVVSKQMLYQNIITAIENGEDGISIANANDQEVFLDPLRERYGADENGWPPEATKQANEARALYQQQYEKTLPSMLKEIGKKYGVKPIRKKLSDPVLNEGGREHWFLPITPEMKKAIQDRGVPLYGSVNDGLLKRRTPTTLDGGLLSGAQVA